MFIELAEALDCPSCGEGFGLVAFVQRSDRRRVLDGYLGCPLCEVEFPIVQGAIDFRPGPSGDAHERAEPESAVPESAAPVEHPLDPEMGVRLVALLGLGERSGSAILLGRGLARYAVHVTRLAERAEILAVLDAEDHLARPGWGIDELAAGVDPILALGPGRWPLRSGALAGVALRGSPGEALEEVWRCLRPGGRLVLLDAEALDPRPLLDRGFEPLAEDENTWVGQRP